MSRQLLLLVAITVLVYVLLLAAPAAEARL